MCTIALHGDCIQIEIKHIKPHYIAAAGSEACSVGRDRQHNSSLTDTPDNLGLTHWYQYLRLEEKSGSSSNTSYKSEGLPTNHNAAM